MASPHLQRHVFTESEVHVNRRGRSFEDAECPDDRGRHSILRLIDLEVLQGSLCLRAPVLVRFDVNLAKGICFDSGRLALRICVSMTFK